ncbi:hypothetical protein NQZ68_006165 [Dissostichus eleginoides]|nr:hypothetical protein NQZ68_006165 [Dissostichus eleginoides]
MEDPGLAQQPGRASHPAATSASTGWEAGGWVLRLAGCKNLWGFGEERSLKSERHRREEALGGPTKAV